MELPHLLPKEIEYTSVAISDENLFNMLVKLPIDLLLFFETASADLTWSEEHKKFYKRTLHWITEQFFLDRLSLLLARRALKAIQDHFSFFSTLIPKNLKVTLEDEEIEVNSLFLGASSNYFRELILGKCRDLNRRVLELKGVFFETFKPIYEFMQTGQVRGMWRTEDQEIIKILEQAAKFDVKELVFYSQEILSRHLTLINVAERLLLAQKRGWPLLKEKAFELLNQQEKGAIIHPSPPEHFVFEFVDFRTQAFHLFKFFLSEITHLVIRGSLVKEDEFLQVIFEPPKLIGLDISDCESFHEHLLNFPKGVQELSLSRSPWVDYRYLEQLFLKFPHLTKISFCQNLQMGYLEWTALSQAKALISLDLSDCRQFSDSDLSLLARSALQLSELRLKGLRALTDVSFQEIARRLNRLILLDLSKCEVSDLALLDITSRLTRLRELDLSSCSSLTEKGVAKALEQTRNLQILNLHRCPFSKSFIDRIQESNPSLKIIF